MGPSRLLYFKDYLIKENLKAHESKTTDHCRLKCSNCGVISRTGQPCFDNKKVDAVKSEKNRLIISHTIE